VARPKTFDPDTAVDRAMTLFWRNGYKPTSPRQLADHLGIGAGSLYNAFGSKHDLFLATLSRYHDQEASKLTDELTTRTGPVRERIRAAVQPHLATTDQAGCFAVNTAVELAGTDERAADLVRRMFDRLRDTLRTLIEEGQRTGEITTDRDPAALAAVLMNAINGLRVLSRTTRDPDELRQILDTTIDLL
jgi:TetR/AcrR family transcriptional repressor of nem operon